MKKFPEELNKQLKDLHGKDNQPLQVTIPEVQKQTNSGDCGCFAIAWAVLLAIGEKPEEVTLDKKQLRPNLIECFQAKNIHPFPHTIKRSQRVRVKNIQVTL